MTVRKDIATITERIRERSRDRREAYLARLEAAVSRGVHRSTLSCGNLAHGFAACAVSEKAALAGDVVPNLGIITAYNDMLSAHAPYETYPALIRRAAADAGGVAQVAGGVPAMCDGVTQGQPGMELSLFSRDVIAMAAGIGLSHNMFDAAVYLGICDKIVPGLTIAALTFGHLPAVFIPAGPMPSGLPNDEKAKTRQLYAEGKVGRAELLEAESKSYHSPGTCTFYGTANSNQMMMEMMGLHTPGSSFINPGTPLRDAMTREATQRALAITALGNAFTPAGRMIDERSIVNAVVGLHATGGSTNHTIHLIAMAAAAGIRLTWQDISDLSDVVPLLARVYPNGLADVNHFHAAGGMGFLIRELLDAGFAHEDVQTIWGNGLRSYATEPGLAQDGSVERYPAPEKSGDERVLIGVPNAFQASGGLKVLKGNLGHAIIKTSAVKPEKRFVEAPAIVFENQEALNQAFKDGDL
ncbi:MAG TPA: phosphogluconate dehydratase, partial [Tianweitania sediminis]|nr:phosphogluconate dehydratase [Tianweitania sediminis]